MSYDSRISQQFRGTQQHQQTRAKKQEDPDAFMRLVSGHLNICAEARRVTDYLKVRQRNCRMYQRHWRPIYTCRSAEAKSAADTIGIRMVRRTVDEYNTRDS